MIICEEKAFERILSLGFCDTAIPVSVRQNIGEEAVITVLPSLKNTAKAFEMLFSGRYFSKQAHEWLKEKVRPFMYEMGYKDNRQSRKITEIMTMDSDSSLPDGNCHILKSDMPNLTSADVSSLIEFGHIVAVKILDDKIVSVAYTNLNPTDCSAVEIGVETATGYRKRGFAKDALRTLINKLDKMNISPIYVCSKTNRASIKLAESLKFKTEAIEYNYVFRRI